MGPEAATKRYIDPVLLLVAAAVVHGICLTGGIAHDGAEGAPDGGAAPGAEAGVVSDDGTGAGADETAGDTTFVHIGIGGGAAAEGDEGEGSGNYEEIFARIH